ncbi:MAG: AMP-binding protein [Acidobacteriota bacterium]|nr:AMP-binding protein [Acidobacteriota bacterium]
MAELLRAVVEARGPDAAALIDERGTLAWGELDRRVNRCIHALRGRGLGPGDRVAVLSTNRREYFEIFAACAHSALLAVPVNWHLVAEEVRYILENSGARALVVDPRFADLACEATAGLGALTVTALLGEEETDCFELYEDLLARASDDEPADQGQGGPMFYTSGTTGHPKGVRRLGDLGSPVGNAQAASQGFSMMTGAPQGGVTLLCGPVYHSAQWAFSYLPLAGGSTVVMRHGFDPEESLRLIDEHSVTNVHLVPTQFVRLLRVAEETRVAFDGSSLKVVWHGAAPCPPDVKRRMIDWWGPVLTEYYGGTEGAIISLISSQEWLERPTSVGRPVPIVEVSILDENGEPCPPGEPGQIFLRSMMATDFEYHGDTAKTAQAHREPGVFTMGDIGVLDDDGYLYLSDRKTDMIISGGVNIYPAEVERVLSEHEAVSDVAVFGIPDAEFGEQVKAVVEVVAGSAADDALAASLLKHCRDYLAGYKVPRSLDFAELPRTETGKLQKRLLREPYWRDRERSI